ncbi:hypothetical protein [Bradyrhizobium sp. CCBAU 65884]|uniref:hypothetical protein n=1 Tax=Bradyrhizobium sp. CCBAU 65884 TaxID=722477 RepID=UPI002304E513|nr:hypothetical protein [Bradyrhizobium sp. CCBAU 65884]
MNKPEDENNLRADAAPVRAKRETRNSVVTLEELPLFADERSLTEALLGPGKYTHWRGLVTLLERRGSLKLTV